MKLKQNLKETLRVIIVGHVDHGKSTLIGKLLSDLNQIQEEKINDIKKICKTRGLKFEWAWKFYSRKLSIKLFPLERRKQALKTLLSLEKPTSKAIPYKNWHMPINVVWEK